MFADRDDQFLNRRNPGLVDQIFDQAPCCNRIACLRPGIPGMPLDCHLASQQYNVWKRCPSYP